MQKLFEIKDDLFDISARIKSVDEDYKIYFNGDTRRYELHNAKKYPAFQLALPFPSLDKRAIDYALKSQVKNKERILAEIERHNRAVEREHRRRLVAQAMAESGL